MSDILANRRPFVAAALGNRADLSQLGVNGSPSRIDNWIWMAYLNLGMSYFFDDVNAGSVPGQWVSGMDFIAYPPSARSITSIAFYQQNGTSVKISWKDIAYLRRYPAGPASIPTTQPVLSIGPPSVVAPFGSKLYVRPYADSNIYNFIADLWLKPVQIVGQSDPTANPPYTSQGSADIGATQILVPDDWLEIVDLGAILRGHTSLLERDKAQEVQSLLFGTTIPTTGKQVPGLIAQMWTRRQAQAPSMDYNIQPRQPKRSYTSVP